MVRNKIDLHLHLDGSVRPETVFEISHREHSEPECSLTLSEIGKSMVIQPGTFDPDYHCFDAPGRIMCYGYAITRITEELVERLVEDGVKAAEIRFAPQFHTDKGLRQEEVVVAAIKGLEKAKGRILTGLILCTMDRGKASLNRKENEETLRVARKYLGRGVLGIDLAGYETDLPNFSYIFETAKKCGIPATCHSEFTVLEALPFGTTRIGHGYQFAESPELMEKAKKRGVTLEMCPISSVKYDYGLSIGPEHPLRTLFLAGAKVTINTDNLTVLDTSLDKEYAEARKMGFTDEEIEECNRNAIRASFFSEEEKAYLLSLTE